MLALDFPHFFVVLLTMLFALYSCWLEFLHLFNQYINPVYLSIDALAYPCCHVSFALFMALTSL
jgi:hypothetical protein